MPSTIANGTFLMMTLIFQDLKVDVFFFAIQRGGRSSEPKASGHRSDCGAEPPYPPDPGRARGVDRILDFVGNPGIVIEF